MTLQDIRVRRRRDRPARVSVLVAIVLVMRDDHLLSWLLDTDPALRWQVERDLLELPPDVWESTRARIATEGMGARLLALQDEDGQWAGGAYFPAGWDFHDEPEEPGQPWTATTWTLNTLREWGLDAAALAGTAGKIDQNARWEYEDLPYWGGEVDCCINGFTLANGIWLGAEVDGLVAWFAQHRMDEGGWNCMWEEGSTRSSVHSTLNALKGLLAYDAATGGTDTSRELRRSGEEYLLERRLHRRLSTGEPISDRLQVFAYPFRWVATVLHSADYFRRAALLDGTPPDPRLAEAIDIIRAGADAHRRWTQQHRYAGRVWFELDVPVGEPSPWLTLFATRVLRWWDTAPLPDLGVRG